MAISIDDIKKLRAMTGAGLADVKKALTEAEGDFDKAKELLRERGLAIAAKRSDRETSNGCVLVRLLTALPPCSPLSVRPTSLPTVPTSSL